MSGIHEIRYEVRPHETGYGKTIQPGALLNYLQDAAFEHSVKLGFSVYHLLAKGQTIMSTLRNSGQTRSSKPLPLPHP